MFNPTTQNQYILDLYPVEDENTPTYNSKLKKEEALFEFTKNEYTAYYRALYGTHDKYYREEDAKLKNVTEEEIRVGTFLEIFEYSPLNLIGILAFPFDYFFTYLPAVRKRIERVSNMPLVDFKEEYKLDREIFNKTDRFTGKSTFSYYIKRREEFDSFQDQNCTNKEVKETKAEALNELRMYLYANDLKLEGEVTTVLKNSAKQVNFGKNANSIINNAFAKHPNDEYVIIEDKDFLKFENKLKELFQEDIKVLYY